ncbi:MAG: phosphoenolpyruvate mutase [Lachnospiraceae bacterium]|nr:phosphoenolpyruvate mutase [Lachnospiraceae bacterium]
MKALILNSGMGTRMGVLTSDQPKCMTEISNRETILSRQLNILTEYGIDEVIMTTGYHEGVLVNYVQSLDLPIKVRFIKNELYSETNYIFSIYCAREYLHGDILLIHGDLVFENSVFDDMMLSKKSCMAVSSTIPLPMKDFKAVVSDEKITHVGINYFSEAIAAQPFYKLLEEDWEKWLARIITFCDSGNTNCYAEEAFNEIGEECNIVPLDVEDRLCNEIDDANDLSVVHARLHEIGGRIVYMCFSTDTLHGGHISIIRKAQRLGKLIVGVLSDEAIASYKRYPLLPFEDRKEMFGCIKGVSRVVEQKHLSYRENLEQIKPDFVVHGDDWKDGFQKSIRDEVVSVLAGYGGRLIEFPYAADKKYRELEARTKTEIAMPDVRRGRLRRILDIKGFATAMEAHDGLTGLVVENTVVSQDGGGHQFDAMWVSSLCDSTAKGKPDIELVDMTSRFRTIEDLMEVTTKPIIFDGDTGGKVEHFVYTVRSLERMGVSMVIIEDKTGLKKNSLFGTEVAQTQEDVSVFCEKIKAGKNAQRTKEFMICARIESLILEKGLEDALFRAKSFVEAGADAIMIHSRQKDPMEIFDFVQQFRETNQMTPIVVVPTSFDAVKEEEFKERGVNIVIYANQLMRATVPAIQKVAETILKEHRAQECEGMLMPFSEIIRLIPEEFV